MLKAKAAARSCLLLVRAFADLVPPTKAVTCMHGTLVMIQLLHVDCQVVVQQCHAAGVDLRGAGLQPGIHLVAAHLNADQAVALLGLVPQAPARPSLAAARQALALSAAQASSHEAMYYCTV